MKKRLFLAMLALSMTAGTAVPAVTAFAADVQETQDFTQTTPDASCDVTINGGDSTFSVTVPKTITGSGKSGTLSYGVTVSGDFAGTEQVKVVPDASVTLSQSHKSDVVAGIKQDKTTWRVDELATTGNGTITYDGVKAGTYTGAFNFNIALETAVENPKFTVGGTSYELEAGMTFRQWCQSAKNTAGFTVSDYDTINSTSGTVIATVSGNINTPVSPDDTIIEGTAYVLVEDE